MLPNLLLGLNFGNFKNIHSFILITIRAVGAPPRFYGDITLTNYKKEKGHVFHHSVIQVVRKQALFCLKTYGLKRFRSLIICKLALFYYNSPRSFLSNWSSDYWLEMIKTIKGSHQTFIWDYLHWCVIILRLPRRKTLVRIGLD